MMPSSFRSLFRMNVPATYTSKRTHAHTHTPTHTQTNMFTFSLYLSPSLSHTHTRIQTDTHTTTHIMFNRPHCSSAVVNCAAKLHENCHFYWRLYAHCRSGMQGAAIEIYRESCYHQLTRDLFMPCHHTQSSALRPTMATPSARPSHDFLRLLHSGLSLTHSHTFHRPVHPRHHNHQSTMMALMSVSFAEYRLFYRYLLQKRPIISQCLPRTPSHRTQGCAD